MEQTALRNLNCENVVVGQMIFAIDLSEKWP